MSSLTREINETPRHENLVRHGVLHKIKTAGLIRAKSFGLGFGGGDLTYRTFQEMNGS